MRLSLDLGLGSVAINQGGVPTWARGADFAWDTVRDQQWGGDITPTDTHIAAILAQSSDGAYTSFAADTLVRTDLGTQVVPSRAQLFTAPLDFSDAAWTKTRATILANAIIAPDGTLTADKLVEDATASSTHSVLQNRSFVSGSTYLITLCAKAGERSRLLVDFGTTRFPAGSTAVFDLANGSVISSGAGLASPATIQPLSDGWYLCSIAGISNSTGAGNLIYYLYSGATNSYSGDGTSGLYLWGANLAAAAFAIPPIFSVGTVDGNQQTLDLTEWANQSEAGLIVGNLSGSVDTNVIWSRNDGTANEWMGLVRDGTKIDFRLIDGGITVVDLEIGNLPSGEFAVAYVVGQDYARAELVGGSTVTADTLVTLPTTTNEAFFGDGFSATNNSYGRTLAVAHKWSVTANDTTFEAWLGRATNAASFF